ncbi:MAG: C4-dicarboxylate TRAP transporter substrate-binding protein [Rhizobiaceae bacterium]|nr:C4-dicarboxylate TRAP transporter substrate-binding protein [Rhizobiaceae bacterium]
MKQFRNWAGVSFVAVAASILAAAPATAQEWLDKLEPRVLKLADFSGDPKANFGAAMVKWEEAITEFTKGKITFENYWSASLLNATNVLQGVGDGVADVGLVIPSYFPKQMPVASWFFGFGAALSGSTVHDVAAGGATSMEFSRTFQPLIDEYASLNLKLLNGTSTPAYNLLCNTPISSPEEAKGKRARAIGAVWSKSAEALGMTTVSIAYNEAYEGLQRGVFECMVLNPNQLVTGAVFKAVAPQYVPVTMAQLQSSSWVINLDTWNSFPKELQEFITKQDVIAAANIWKGYLVVEGKVGDAITAGEVKVNDAAKLEPVVAAQRAQFVQDMAASAPASVTDAAGVIKSYQERVGYWTKALIDEGHPIVERNPEAVMKAFTGLSSVDLTPFIQKYDTEMTPKFLGAN